MLCTRAFHLKADTVRNKLRGVLMKGGPPSHKSAQAVVTGLAGWGLGYIDSPL